MKKTKLTNYTSGFQTDTMRVKLRYRVHGYFTVIGGSTYALEFSGNSPYDPDFTFVGSSAFLWNWCSVLYDKYMCTYSKCKVKFFSQAQGQYMSYCQMKRGTTQATPVTVDDYYANPGAKVVEQVFNGLSEAKVYTMESKGSTKQVLGRAIDPSLDRVDVSSDPTEEWIHSWKIFNETGISEDRVVRYNAELTYWVTFSYRNTLS